MCDLRTVSILILCMDDLYIGISGVLKSPSIIIIFFTVGFPFNGQLYFSYVFRWSYVGCMFIYNCNMFFLDLSLYHYLVSFLGSCNNLYLKVFYLMRELLLQLFLFRFAWNILFQALTFSLCVSLRVAWMYKRQQLYGSCFCFRSTTLCFSWSIQLILN